MKATGVVRRIDDLGRIVVPKEIRKTLRIREGDPMEIYTGKEGEVILKKYSPMADLTQFAQQYVEAVSKSLNVPVAVSDRDSIIAAYGLPKKQLIGKYIHRDLEEVIQDRKAVIAQKGEDRYVRIIGDDEDYEGEIVQTIICQGDAIGAVIVISKDAERLLGEIEMKTAMIAATFLGRQMEG